jgi:hypothetical protein
MENNGLITKIWGPPLWTSLHCITFGYPIKPTEQQKKDYKNFFIKLGDVLPCKYCRDSYKEYILEGSTKLDNNAMKNRKALTKWLYDLHEKVNNKLGVEYGINYDDLQHKYEKFRARCSTSINKETKGCVVPLHKKRECYIEALKKDCPLISYENGKIFKKYADMRNIKKKYYYFWDIINKNNGKLNREYTDLKNRYCTALINHMRIHNIQSIEKTGKYKGLPTIQETKLLLCLSSNLCNKEINECLQTFNNRFNSWSI